MATRVGILCNPLSGRIRARRDAICDAAAAVRGALLIEAATGSDMDRALDDLAARGVELLAVVGGDGTAHAALSHLLGRAADSWSPVMAVVPAGSTNMTATDFGIRGGPVGALARLGRLLASDAMPPAQSRHVLRIEHAGTRVHGMFFGMGLIASGVRYFLDHVRGRGLTGEKASALVMARYLARMLFPSSRREWGEWPATLRLDGEPCAITCYTLVLATTLRRLLLGTRPYWGTETAPIHATAIETAPRRMWRSLPSVLRGRGAALRASDGYLSRNVSSLSVRMQGEFAVDGELYSAAADAGPVEVSSAGPVRFLAY